jgi:hypothetical protein
MEGIKVGDLVKIDWKVGGVQWGYVSKADYVGPHWGGTWDLDVVWSGGHHYVEMNYTKWDGDNGYWFSSPPSA